jgi:hypothetical protein
MEETLIQKLAIGLNFTLMLIGLAFCPDLIAGVTW